MCNARQVRMIRAAISPRLAISMRRIAKRSIRLDDAQEDFAVLDECPVAAAMTEQVLSLPVHQHLGDDDLALIVDSVRAALT